MTGSESGRTAAALLHVTSTKAFVIGAVLYAIVALVHWWLGVVLTS